MPRLTKGRVLEEAIDLLDEVGLDALTMRKLAERLGVQAGALYWHYENKQLLLGAIAEHMLGSSVVESELDPARWIEQLTEQINAFRRALLAHRDGGRVFAGTFVAAPNTLGRAESIVATLRSAGLPPREAAWAMMSLVYFIIGFVVEEQAAAGLDAQTFLASVEGAQFPHIAEAAAHFIDTDYDARFTYGLGLMLAGVQRTSEGFASSAPPSTQVSHGRATARPAPSARPRKR